MFWDKDNLLELYAFLTLHLLLHLREPEEELKQKNRHQTYNKSLYNIEKMIF